MDWLLSITTLLANSNLGWSRGAAWAWWAHIANALLWVAFAVMIDKPGLILLSAFTIAVDGATIYRKHKRNAEKPQWKV